MSKNELRVIARIMLIGVGLYVLLQTLLIVLSSIASFPMIVSSQIKPGPLMIIISLCIYAALAMAAAYFLVRCSNRFSAKIVESEPVEDTQVSWLAVAFRLICVSAGVLFLYWSVPNLIMTLHTYMTIKPNQHYMSAKSDIVKYVIMLGLSIYLAYGAPGFVRWQVKKTIRQCNKTIEQQPTWR
jgi:hypothetical protein